MDTHPKADLTPGERAFAAHMNRHLLLRHGIGGISSVWSIADLRQFHDDLHLHDGKDPSLHEGSPSP